MDINDKGKRIWEDLQNINRTGGMISAAEAVAGLNNHDLDALAQDLLAKGKTLTPFRNGSPYLSNTRL